jgi:hypothetical protein
MPDLGFASSGMTIFMIFWLLEYPVKLISYNFRHFSTF